MGGPAAAARARVRGPSVSERLARELAQEKIIIISVGDAGCCPGSEDPLETPRVGWDFIYMDLFPTL